jgi:hypothetical protein
VETDEHYLTEQIIHYSGNSSGGTWTFQKFEEYVDGTPKSVEIEYDFDADNMTLTRSVKGKVMKQWEGVTWFFIRYYGLLPQHRYFYRIELELVAGEDGITKEQERFMLVTSVESRYENTLVNFAGWIVNPASKIEEIK